MFSHFLINFLFLKILAFLAQKTEILAKKWFKNIFLPLFKKFGPKNHCFVNFSKNTIFSQKSD